LLHNLPNSSISACRVLGGWIDPMQSLLSEIEKFPIKTGALKPIAAPEARLRLSFSFYLLFLGPGSA